MTVRSTSRLVTGLAAPLAAAAFVVGCGGGGGNASTTGGSSSRPSGGVVVGVDPHVAKEVPAAVKKKGTLTVAADASYPPNESFAPDGKTIVGMDPDLAKALAAVMGLKANIVNASFDGILPGLAAHKYDLGMSSLGDTKVREKTVDFVTYFRAGTSFYVKAQGGPAIGALADLCGHKAAVEKGTTQQNDASAQDKKCRAGGKPGVSVLTFPDQNGANLALSSGRADVVMADTPPATYAVEKSAGRFKLVGPSYGAVPYGIAIPRANGMAKPVLAAVKALMADGRYTPILKRWRLQTGAIANPTINGAIG